MVLLTRIYTKGGDKGKTSLGSGIRVMKYDPRIQAIGDVDEINASIGVASLYVSKKAQSQLIHIQHDLFDLGADLCLPDDAAALRISESQVTWLEDQIDALNEDLPPLTSFVLPGGTKAAAFLHVSRTVTRRAERTTVYLGQEAPLNKHVAIYLNRLSDYLFVLARHENDDGRLDVLWQPGKNQTA